MSKKLTSARIIAVAGLKGGLGKTTMAILLACWYAVKQGKKVLFVDADPKSQTAYEWSRDAAKAIVDDDGNVIKMAFPLPFTVERWPFNDVGELVDNVKNDYDLIIIDVGGEGNEILSSAMQVATRLLVAMTPRRADMKRLHATLKTAATAVNAYERGDEVATDIVLTMVQASRNGRFLKDGRFSPGRNDEVRAQIEAQGWPLLESYLSYRERGYADLMGQNPFDDDLEADMSQIESVAAELDAIDVVEAA